MEKYPLVIYSPNSRLAQIVKGILEKTGVYEIKVEDTLTEVLITDTDVVETLVVADCRKSYTKVLTKKNLIFFGEFVFDPNFRTLCWKEQQSFHLLIKESEILLLLLENAGDIVKRDFILYSYWGEVSRYKSRSLDVVISKLRKMLRLDPSVSIVNYTNEGLSLRWK